MPSISLSWGRALVALVALIAGVAATIASPPVAAADAGPGLPPERSQVELVEQLRGGGYVIYMRHARTDRSRTDRDDLDLADCATQRPLSDLGRAEAAAVGESLRALEIPVGTVLTSPYCRCAETAELVFGRGERSEDLYYARDLTDAERGRLSRRLRAMLATPPDEGTNTFIVSHTSNLEDAVGIHPRPEGVAIVFETGPDGEARVVGRLLPASWPELARARLRVGARPARAAD